MTRAPAPAPRAPTAAGQMLPGWGEMILPPAHARLGCLPMLDKEKMTIWPQHPTHLLECALDFGDAAHGPCRHDSIDIMILNGNGLRRAFNEPYRDRNFRAALFAISKSFGDGSRPMTSVAALA